MKTLPGTLWINRGRWNWRVRLPGSDRRQNIPLRPPGQSAALAEARGRDLAESIAWRIWENAGREAIEPAHDTRMTLDGAISRFLAHAHDYYRRSDGSPSREAANCEIALRSLRGRHGARSVDDLGYNDIAEAREGLIRAGLHRTTINQRVGIWKRFFAWALEQRLCAASTKSEACALTNLKPNRSPAMEGDPVQPIAHAIVKKTLAYLPPNLRAMVRVQELCGARPAEICDMRPCDIEQRPGIWIYRPSLHKTAHRGQPRAVCLGPRAQSILVPLLASTAAGHRVFRPDRAMRERKTPKGRPRASRLPGQHWTATNYGQAVRYALKAASKAGVEIEAWSPNQLRHACGTRVRRAFGPDVARAVLGHADSTRRITDRYTQDAIERELIALSSRAMRRFG